MITLYFSGTGNSRFVAETFSRHAGGACHSIEEPLNFAALLARQERICFCYPVYGSCVPRIMRDFVLLHREYLEDKKLVILATQFLFSGDGARAFTDLLQAGHCQVVCADHIRMPNNICNFPLFPVKDASRCARRLRSAQRQVVRAVRCLESGVVRRRGFSAASRLLGFLTQRLWFLRIEDMAGRDVRVTEACTSCGICVQTCPRDNLFLTSGPPAPNSSAPGSVRVEQRGRCTLCYRCVNTCPEMAITVLWHGPVRRQYHGP
ncbi:EFR1 family ferrodoxin [Alkalispirochaeta alkalica]|uniref:EFR1 family ferrodoxin n=1 Tax=Alkalispirochaeta alkalica TaxID=46356 RepID=UPI000379140B|nr:EFR1 family ferrodoxin [Alkalispirochaeta alkalica]